ncbi:MAG: M20/M25/M40 family metallo-hydrolase, partial [Acidobacteriota bacterium]
QMSAPSLLVAQTTDQDLAAIATWVAVDSATGYEGRTSPALAAALGGGWTSDAWGNVVTTVGTGSPHRIVACALDRPSYAVSQITDDGYLRVHRIGSGSRHPLWDQQFEAQQIRVLTLTGPVAGVVARSNGHFGPQHAKETVVVTADDLWVDVGASSRADVEAMGIALLDPMSRQLPPWPIAGGVAGPDAGRRVGCAAVVAAAAAGRRDGAPGRTTFVLSAQQVTGWVGLSSLVARDQKVDAVTVLAPGEQARAEADQPSEKQGSFGAVLSASGLRSVHWVVPAVDQAGSHMEVVRANEAQWLAGAAAKGAGLDSAQRPTWIAAAAPASLRTASADGSLTEVASLLTNLVERYGVSGHEWSVRRTVLDALPKWARDLAVVDDMGNIVVEVGPQGPPTVFMAHMDEVGFIIESIAPDGTVSLAPQGGAVSSAWEGQTALVHFDPPGAPSKNTGRGTDMDPKWKTSSLAATAPAPLRGVFRVRFTADRKDPGSLQAWFGLDAQGLAARGVSAGMQVTSYKQGVRLGPTRFTARSEDDRAGTTALLRAVNQIDPARLPGRVIFAWSIGEEGGLVGATAMAHRFGARTARIYSLDTFVSSDTPLESHHFAYAPLGAGPVFRAIESANVSPDAERQRVQRIAAAAGIPLQMGLTQGGTDGSSFTFWGAPNQGLSWPGRYSHSPGEVLDLRDLDRLGRLIVAIVTTSDR